MLRNPLALSRAPRPVSHSWTGHTETLGRGSSVPTLILSVISQSHQQMPGSLVVSLRGVGLPFSRLVGDRAEEGEPRWQGREAGRGPHSTLQQLMQPFWEP